MISLKIEASLDKCEVTAAAQNLTKAARLTVQTAARFDNASLTILLAGDERLRQLNRQFRGIDAPTDVLSYFLGETDPDTGEHYLGDVIISFPRAQAQAQERGHSTAEELDLLVVHGVLHLLGYDHADAEERDRMWAVQRQILHLLGRDIKIADEAVL